MNNEQAGEKSLPAIFAEAREVEPHFSAIEFTDAVIDGLPQKKTRSRKWTVFADIAAAVLGTTVFIALLPDGFVGGVVDSVNNAQLTISSMTIGFAAAVVLSASLFGWWLVEGRNQA